MQGMALALTVPKCTFSPRSGGAYVCNQTGVRVTKAQLESYRSMYLGNPNLWPPSEISEVKELPKKDLAPTVIVGSSSFVECPHCRYFKYLNDVDGEGPLVCPNCQGQFRVRHKDH